MAGAFQRQRTVAATAASEEALATRPGLLRCLDATQHLPGTLTRRIYGLAVARFPQGSGAGDRQRLKALPLVSYTQPAARQDGCTAPPAAVVHHAQAGNGNDGTIGWIRQIVLDGPDPQSLATFWASLLSGSRPSGIRAGSA